MATITNHRIAGTRITVWDILHHLDNNWSIESIADVLNLSVEQVQAAVDYIRDHRDDVIQVHRSIEQRNARGNAPEIAAKVAAAHAKRLLWLKNRQETMSQERPGVGNRC